MKRISGVIGLLVLLAVSTVSAQDLKFGIIDTQKLLSMMPERQEAQKQFERERQSISTQLEEMQVELNNKMQRYTAQRDTLTETALQMKEEELQNLQQRISNFQGRAQEILKRKESELFEPIMQKAQEAIKAVGDEEGFTFIIDKNQFLYYSESQFVNVLPKVKAKLGIE